jgi:hypothetical protein
MDFEMTVKRTIYTMIRPMINSCRYGDSPPAPLFRDEDCELMKEQAPTSP